MSGSKFRSVTFKEYDGRWGTGRIHEVTKVRTVKEAASRLIEMLEADPEASHIHHEKGRHRVGCHTPKGYRVWSHRGIR